jgi:hypothetical protein
MLPSLRKEILHLVSHHEITSQLPDWSKLSCIQAFKIIFSDYNKEYYEITKVSKNYNEK